MGRTYKGPPPHPPLTLISAPRETINGSLLNNGVLSYRRLSEYLCLAVKVTPVHQFLLPGDIYVYWEEEGG